MARAIDVEDLIRIVSEKKMTEVFPNWKELSSETRNAIGVFGQYWKALIEDAPTIDPVKHGKWEWVYDGMYDRDWTCSVCKKIPPRGERTKHCPNCGARMDGE